MPRKPEPVAAPAVIKWTEEEWELIARRLLDIKGPELLQSAQLEEVKAKDVFLAQECLPEDRHRKLISISQGFQAIRQRLHGILQKVRDAAQDDLFSKSDQSSATPVATAAVTADEPKPRTSRKAAKQIAPVDAQPTAPIPAESKDTAGDEPSPMAPRVEEQPVSAVPTDTGTQLAQGHRNNARQAAPRQSHIEHPKVRAQAVQSPLPPATGDFIEMARPFVSMFCQELASALVSKMMEQGGSQAVSSSFQAAFSGVSQSASREQPRRHEPQGKPSYSRPSFQDGPGMTAEPSIVSSHAYDEEDGEHAEADVQPLFDPKLPPSANSAFKPMIALIGTSPRDFEDLQQYFPQLELKVVPLEELRTAPSLRSCQRMMGLREDIPAPADEYLRKTFRNRYLRVIGGISQVREQLNAWLSNPSTVNEQPRWPRKQGSPNGKGQGTGFPKKKQFRRPKPAP
ncbi:hypothetical protein RY831_32425 [Noviherbaspirillum sp. CPCC 100848]|uniref:Uncharacterized protein n=1 Tax=Noviherbaspirillum album TaxID=3080276 RepID=A0ABU6JJV8_9BURK|nr:hypothetical protein [Noviherbaspirillum sp. CPCC 100848]MEC4723825.1 hypothetical protein [Noviherbaspirillum sp. CPCC 100848]